MHLGGEGASWENQRPEVLKGHSLEFQGNHTARGSAASIERDCRLW